MTQSLSACYLCEIFSVASFRPIFLPAMSGKLTSKLSQPALQRWLVFSGAALEGG